MVAFLMQSVYIIYIYISLDMQTPSEVRYLHPKKHTDQTPNLKSYDWMSRVYGICRLQEV